MKTKMHRLHALLFSFTLSLVFVLGLMLSPAASAAESEGVLTYEGLSVRLTHDSSGIRSLWRINKDAVKVLENEGYTVACGAILGIGEAEGESRLTTDDLAVTGNAKAGYTAVGAGTAAITVYVTGGADYASGVYTDEAAGEFAYTVVYGGQNETREMYLGYGLVFAGFVALTDGQGNQRIEYVRAEGPLFGNANAAYGNATTLAEISDYFVNRYAEDEALRYVYNKNERLRTTLARAGWPVRTDITLSPEATLDALLAANPEVKNLFDGWMYDGTFRAYGNVIASTVTTNDAYGRGIAYSTVGYDVPASVPGGAVLTMSNKEFVSEAGHVGLLKITARASYVAEGETAEFLAVLKNQTGKNSLREVLTVGEEYTTFYIPVTTADLCNRFNAQLGYDKGQSAESDVGGQTILFTEIEFYDFGKDFDISLLPSGKITASGSAYEAADAYTRLSIYGSKILYSDVLSVLKSNVASVKLSSVTLTDDLFDSGLSISTKSQAPTTAQTQGATYTLPSAIGTAGHTGLLRVTVRAPYSADGNAKFRLRLVGSSAFLYEEYEIAPDNEYVTLYIPFLTAAPITKINIFVGGYNQAPSADGNTVGGQELIFTEFEIMDFGTKLRPEDLPSGAYAYTDIPLVLFEEGEENEDASIVISDAAFAGRVELIKQNGATASILRDAGLAFGDNLYSVSVGATGEAESVALSYLLTDKRKAKYEAGDLLLLTFYARAFDSTGKITPMLQSASGQNLLTYTTAGVTMPISYYIPAQWSKFVLPIVAPADLDRVALTFGDTAQTVQVAGVSLVKSEESIEDVARFTGVFLAEDVKEIEIKEEKAISELLSAALDIVTTEERLYAIGDGALVIADISGKNANAPVKLGSLSGLGNVRQLAVDERLGIALVTGRADGIYVIDINNPQSPTLSSYYNSIEMATGISMTDGYAFIANRSFGVEVVDFNTPDTPRHVVNIRCDGNAAQSCEVIDGIMYAGIWAAQEVAMYDVTDLKNPVYLGAVSLNGRGDGFAVHKDKDGRVLLYAATGQHTYNVAMTSPLTDPRYGQGNGMEIFDVTNPDAPVFLSCVKTDGRFFWSGNDFWEVSYAEDASGNAYAFLVSTYNGVFVYNVNDPEMPERLAHFYISIPPTSANFVKVYKTSSFAPVFPFDFTNPLADKWDPVGALSVKDGVMYLAGVETGVYAVALDTSSITAKHEVGDAVLTEKESGIYDTYDAIFTRTELRGQIQAIEEWGDYYYVAAGDAGIHVLDKNLSLVFTLATGDAVQYLQIVNGVLYAAQSHDGLCFYQINEGRLTPIGSPYIPEKYSNDASMCVRMCQITPDGKYAALQIGSSTLRIVDVSNLSAPVSVAANKSSGQMYFRNLSLGFIDNRYLVAYGSGSQYYVYDLYYPMGDGTTTVKLVKQFSNNNINYNGLAAFGDKVLGTAAFGSYGGYFLYDPTEVDAAPTSAGALAGRVSGLGAGKPSVYTYQGATYLFVAERVAGKIYILDITSTASPVLLFSTVITGNPDLIYLGSDGTVFIPAAYQGLLSFSIDEIK